MIADGPDGNLLVVLTNTDQGALYVELLQLLDKSQGVRYPRRQLTTGGAQTVRAVWDRSLPSSSLGIIICYTSGGIVEAEPSRFICKRRRAQWLVDDAGLEMGGKLALIVMISFIGVFCCVRHCNQAGRGRAPVFNRRRLVSDERGRQRRSASQARLRELRQQLAEIPDAVEEQAASLQTLPGVTRRQSGGEGAEAGAAPSTGAAPAALEVADRSPSSSTSDLRSWASPARSVSDECPICQNEVTVRVVLRPCGHTACKRCVARIVEMQPSTCPFCRSAIDGVQTVYL